MYAIGMMISLVVILLVCITSLSGQAINPMMYGMGMYMNPYYTGFYGGFGNMGHMNPLGYQISSGMAIPGVGNSQNQQSGYGGGYGGGGSPFGAATAATLPRPFMLFSLVILTITPLLSCL